MADKYTADQLDALKAKGHTFPGGTSYPIDDAEDLTAAIKVAGPGNEDHDAPRRYIMSRAKEMGLSAEVPDNWNTDGSLKAGRSEDLTEVLGVSGPCERTFTLDDISIRAGGDGRTVVAYAAVFNAPAEVSDQDGHYYETIDPAGFTKTINERAGRIGVFYNHGKTIYGTPSERFSMPLGTPEEIRPDGRGLLTVTRYNRNLLADEVLESIRNGDIAGQSFSGKFISSRRKRGQGGDLDTIHRSEVALREYGPTPMPVYREAGILGVRMEELVDTMRALTEEQRSELHALLDASTDVARTATTGTDAGHATSVTTPTPVIHEGPTQDQRQRRARVLALRAP